MIEHPYTRPPLAKAQKKLNCPSEVEQQLPSAHHEDDQHLPAAQSLFAIKDIPGHCLVICPTFVLNQTAPTNSCRLAAPTYSRAGHSQTRWRPSSIARMPHLEPILLLKASGSSPAAEIDWEVLPLLKQKHDRSVRAAPNPNSRQKQINKYMQAGRSDQEQESSHK